MIELFHTLSQPHSGHDVEPPGQVWVADITYIRLGRRFIYLAVILNAYTRTVKEEHVDYTEYSDFEDAYRQLKHWLEVTYMTKRVHQSLDYVTPADFEIAAQANPRYLLLNLG